MIHYLATDRGTHTIRKSLPYFPPDLQRRIRLVRYDALFLVRELPAGTHVFFDFDWLKPAMAARAAAVWHELERSGALVRLLDYPLRSMRRFELLKTLRQMGINDFEVLTRTFPDREVVQVPAIDIVRGGGGIHCITQQQPVGTPVPPPVEG